MGRDVRYYVATATTRTGRQAPDSATIYRCRDSPVTILRRKRSRIHFQLAKHERMVAIYREKLAGIEAAIRELSPELDLPVRFRRPNPVFVRGELPRVVLDVLREAGEPLPVREIAVRALARKGATLPGPTLRKYVRGRVRECLGKMERRGVVWTVGSGRGTKRGLKS